MVLALLIIMGLIIAVTFTYVSWGNFGYYGVAMRFMGSLALGVSFFTIAIILGEFIGLENTWATVFNTGLATVSSMSLFTVAHLKNV